MPRREDNVEGRLGRFRPHDFRETTRPGLIDTVLAHQ
jgi:hypothetical protein